MSSRNHKRRDLFEPRIKHPCRCVELAVLIAQVPHIVDEAPQPFAGLLGESCIVLPELDRLLELLLDCQDLLVVQCGSSFDDPDIGFPQYASSGSNITSVCWRSSGTAITLCLLFR